MSIKYVILNSKLVNSTTGYVGRVHSDKSVTFDQVVDRVAHSNTTVSRSDVLSVLEDFFTTAIDMVLDGKSVLTPLVVLRAGLHGTFENAGDGYDRSRHTIVACLRAGPRLRQALATAQLVKTDAARPLPVPRTYIDVTSGTQDELLTPGGPGQLLGRRLLHDAADPAQGVFFTDANGAETRVEAMVVNERSQLAFIVPALPAGRYKVQVRAAFTGPDDIRSGDMGSELTVS